MLTGLINAFTSQRRYMAIVPELAADQALGICIMDALRPNSICPIQFDIHTPYSVSIVFDEDCLDFYMMMDGMSTAKSAHRNLSQQVPRNDEAMHFRRSFPDSPDSCFPVPAL